MEKKDFELQLFLAIFEVEEKGYILRDVYFV